MTAPILFTLTLAGAAAAGTLAVRIVDEGGVATPARVYLTSPAGEARFPAGSIVYRKGRGVTEEHFVPPAGSFEIEAQAGNWRVVIERGKEYVPITDDVAVPAAGRVERTYRLRRWVSMNDLGWYSGDMHFHRALRDTATLMAAEDLNVATPITHWRYALTPISEDPDLNAYLAKSDEHGAVNPAKDRWFTVLNEELEPPSSALLTSRLGKQRSALDYPLPSYGRAIRERGGLVDSEKATSLELPAVAALGGCDVVGLANNHIWRAGSYPLAWGSWPGRTPGNYPATCAGFARAGFDIYYALLNMGFPLKLSAGTASGVHPVPPGWSRIYAHVPGAFSLDRWFEAVKAGRSFVTTEPMLLLTVNGLEPGQESRSSKFPLKAEVSVKVLSREPVGSVEIVVNGKPLTLKGAPQPGGGYTARGQITLETSSWIAARWLSDHGEKCGLAHTSPVYLWNGSQEIPVRRSDAEYLLARVNDLIRDFETGRKEPGESDPVILVNKAAQREETLGLLRQAREVYQHKLEQSH